MTGFFRRVGAIARKEFIHIRRDPRMIISVLVMPVLQLLLFAYAISFDVRDVPTVVLDEDRTPASRAFIDAYEHSDFFRVVGRIPSVASVDEVFDDGTARVAVVVRSGYGESIERGRKGSAAVFVDGSEPNSAQLGQAYALALTERLSQNLLVEWAEAQGMDLNSVGRVEPRVRTWYNPERKSADFLIPGLMVVIVMIVTVQQTAVTLVKEREQGTLEQLVVSPLHRGELVLGKVLPWVILAFLDTFAIAAAGILIFGVPLRGSVPTLALASFLFVLCSLAMGLVVSALANSTEVANFVALIVSFLPGFMFSGFAFPLNSIPRVLQWASYLFPGRYMVVVSRAVFLKGAGLSILWPQVTALAVYAVVSLTLASVLYSRRVQR